MTRRDRKILARLRRRAYTSARRYLGRHNRWQVTAPVLRAARERCNAMLAIVPEWVDLGGAL